MNSNDMRERCLEENQPVFVKSETGTYGPVLARAFEIRQGNALVYYLPNRMFWCRNLSIPNPRPPLSRRYR